MKYSKIVIILIMLLSFSFGSQNDLKKDEVPAIVSIDWLNKNIKNPRVVIVDLRPYDEFKKEHIKGAVNIPAGQNLFDEKKFMPGLEFLKKVFSNAGIDNNSMVVAYDDGKFIFAARFYWILETLGHNNVGILNIGYSNLQKSKLSISTIEDKIVAKNFIPRVDSTKVQTKLSTLMAIGNKTIIDGRKSAAYAGLESKASRFGHIPTAKNYACTQNYQVTKDGNQMKNLQDLKGVYKDLPKEKEIILYCDGGAESALNYIVLQELGYKVSVYDGSWLEWGNDPKVPIENPAQK